MKRRVEKTCSAAKYRSSVFQRSCSPTFNEVGLEAMFWSQKAGILWVLFELPGIPSSKSMSDSSVMLLDCRV